MSHSAEYIFKYEDLKKVYQEAKQNSCSLFIAKDTPGLYIGSWEGERDEADSQIHLAFAQGYNAEVDDPDLVSQLLDKDLGDDFGKIIALNDQEIMLSILFEADIKVTFTEKTFKVIALT